VIATTGVITDSGTAKRNKTHDKGRSRCSFPAFHASPALGKPQAARFPIDLDGVGLLSRTQQFEQLALQSLAAGLVKCPGAEFRLRLLLRPAEPLAAVLAAVDKLAHRASAVWTHLLEPGHEIPLGPKLFFGGVLIRCLQRAADFPAAIVHPFVVERSHGVLLLARCLVSLSWRPA
jgi:hypothetical protein